ncbi:hypothetical protein BG015_005256 [Linnemannia schmuckeri]|uniref:Uncharacterized protein n=1 Tax=Linnemannia schmuckeri TaxID=64567 RepID=A0A9P5R8K4_9FUNG|nr:hypothetical protein BG015_005256 [Linnemannia schmuckeri]
MTARIAFSAPFLLVALAMIASVINATPVPVGLADILPGPANILPVPANILPDPTDIYGLVGYPAVANLVAVTPGIVPLPDDTI